MTDTDKPAFLQAMARLCVALREKDPDTTQLRVYFAALADVDIEFVTAAGESLMKGQWFPKASEWRDEAARIEWARVQEQRALLRKLPAPLCAACDDTGWSTAREVDGVRRVERCSCQRVRRLEILGRAPWPQLPEHVEAPALIDVMPAVRAAVKGMR